jgi:WhiB family redox-sensing transcriptional regulator
MSRTAGHMTKKRTGLTVLSLPFVGNFRTTEWMDLGLCRDNAPEIFFPSDGAGVEKARKICSRCDVKDLCLEYALVEEIEHGVWGGASERERRRIKKRGRDGAA